MGLSSILRACVLLNPAAEGRKEEHPDAVARSELNIVSSHVRKLQGNRSELLVHVVDHHGAAVYQHTETGKRASSVELRHDVGGCEHPFDGRRQHELPSS